MNKKQLIITIAKFMNEKGKVLDLMEYRSYGTEVPVKDFHARRYWGTWARVMAACNKFVDKDTVKAKEIYARLSFVPPTASAVEIVVKGAINE